MKLTPYLVVAVILGGIETDTPFNKFAHWRRLKTALTDFFAFQVFIKGPSLQRQVFLGKKRLKLSTKLCTDEWTDTPIPRLCRFHLPFWHWTHQTHIMIFARVHATRFPPDPLFLSFICPRLRPNPRKSWSWKPPPSPSSQVALATIRVSRAATATTILAREATTIQPLD